MKNILTIFTMLAVLLMLMVGPVSASTTYSEVFPIKRTLQS